MEVACYPMPGRPFPVNGGSADVSERALKTAQELEPMMNRTTRPAKIARGGGP
ncbi:MAG: hypothetical protein JWQ98_129 [Chlorobi bacterium]|nr:hypothetical protein [Chlorobiota bacterium]